MSAPKKSRKTPMPKCERIHPHTEKLRQQVLTILQQNVNRPVENLQQLTGADKSQLNVCKEWLQQRGYNVLSLTKGYILLSDTLPTFPEIPASGPLTCAVNDSRLTITNGRDTITAPLDECRQAFLKIGVIPEIPVPETPIPETNRKFQQQTGRRSGRPAAELPTDRTPLLKTFQECSAQGRPLYRTGKQGVFARREELPEEYRQIGRDRLERLVMEMIQDGSLNLPHLTPSN